MVLSLLFSAAVVSLLALTFGALVFSSGRNPRTTLFPPSSTPRSPSRPTERPERRAPIRLEAAGGIYTADRLLLCEQHYTSDHTSLIPLVYGLLSCFSCKGVPRDTQAHQYL